MSIAKAIAAARNKNLKGRKKAGKKASRKKAAKKGAKTRAKKKAARSRAAKKGAKTRKRGGAKKRSSKKKSSKKRSKKRKVNKKAPFRTTFKVSNRKGKLKCASGKVARATSAKYKSKSTGKTYTQIGTRCIAL